MPEFLRRFFFGGERLEFRGPGSVEDAKRMIWRQLEASKADKSNLSGIVWADSVHLSWQHRHVWNDFRPVFHGHLRSEEGEVFLAGRISAPRSCQLVMLIILTTLLVVAVLFASPLFVPLASLGMALLFVLMIGFCRGGASEDEQKIIQSIQEIFEKDLTATRTRGS
ncbi:MAG: hypothetical protein V4662_14375 [Verrucomicrobiota bacterium]